LLNEIVHKQAIIISEGKVDGLFHPSYILRSWGDHHRQW